MARTVDASGPADGGMVLLGTVLGLRWGECAGLRVGWRRRVWLRACRDAGLDGLTFHDLRRANATGLVAEGVDLKTAQTRLGHSDPRLTLAIYAQATSEGDRAAADRLGERFMGQAPRS